MALADEGEIPALVKMRAKFPPGLIAITRLPGLGPKRARRLYDELGIDSLESLRTAAEEQKIRALKGFGPKAEEAILANLRLDGAGERPARIVLSRALAVGEPLVAALREHPAAIDVELAGSARRMTDTVKDLDVIATATDPLALARAAAALDLVEEAGTVVRSRRAAADAHRDPRRPEDRRARPVRKPAPAPDRLQAAQHGAARRGCPQGPARVRVRGPRRRHRRDPPLRHRAGGVRTARAGVHRARAAREPGRARGRRRGHAPEADRDLRPARRPALPHDRVRRDRLDRGDGAGRARRTATSTWRSPTTRRASGSATRSRPTGCASRSPGSARSTSTGSSCSPARRSTSSPTGRPTTPTRCSPSSTG